MLLEGQKLQGDNRGPETVPAECPTQSRNSLIPGLARNRVESEHPERVFFSVRMNSVISQVLPTTSFGL